MAFVSWRALSRIGQSWSYLVERPLALSMGYLAAFSANLSRMAWFRSIFCSWASRSANQDVGQFGPDLGRVGVLGLLPEKLFKELSRLDAQSGRQVFGVMELRPVALVPELPD